MSAQLELSRPAASLRMQVMLAVGLLFVLMLGIAAVLAFDRRRESVNHAIETLRATANAVAGEQGRIVGDAKQLLSVVARTRDLEALARSDACGSALGIFVEGRPHVSNISVIRPDGLLTCAVAPGDARTDLSDRAYFKAALMRRDAFVGEAVFSRITGKWVLPVVQAVRDADGRLAAILVVSIDLAWLNRRLGEGGSPDDVRLGVLDARGTVIARHPDPEHWIGRNAARTPFFGAVASHPDGGTVETVGFDNVPRLYILVPFADTTAGRLMFWLGVSKQTVVGAIERQFLWTLAAAALLATVAAAVFWQSSERLFVRPIAAIADCARRLGKGEASARTNLPDRADEIGRLARSVDEMAESLASTNQLLRANRALRVLSALNQCLVHAGDEATLLSGMCRAIVEAGNFRVAWIGYAEHDLDRTVRPVASWGADEGFLAGLEVTWADDEGGRGPCGTAIREAKPVVVQNALTDPVYLRWRARAQQYGYASSASFPLEIGGQVIGVLTIYAADPDAFGPDEVSLFAEGAADLAFGIASQRSRVELVRASDRARAASLYARSLIEASLDPLVTISADGKITDVNHATEQATGLARDQLMGTELAGYFTDPAAARGGYERVLAEGLLRDYPLTLRHRSGRTMDVVYNATTLRDEQGKVVGVLAAARDITDRKRIEEQLRAASLYTRSLIEASLDPLVAISADGKITDVNQATEAMTGIGRDQLVGTDFAHYFTDPQQAKAGYEQVMREGRVQDYPLTLRHRSGTTFDVQYNASTYRDQRGEVRGIFAVARDVTERKRAERERAYLAAIVESSGDAILGKDLDGTITSWNDGAENLYGYSAAEAIGQPIGMLAPPGQEQEVLNLIERIASERADRRIEARRVRKDGALIDVSLVLSPIVDEGGKVTGVSTVARDITDRKRAEDQARAASLYARSLIEASPDPLVTISAEGLITDVNHATEQVTGVPRATLLGTDFAGYFTAPELARAGYQRVFRDGVVRDYPLAIRHVSGATIDVLYNASVYRDGNGKVAGVFAAARDITERKRAQEELDRLNRQLETRVEQRTAELAVANKELESFSYSVSHDLRVPLRAIDGFSLMLLEDYAATLDDEGKRLLGVVRDNTTKMARLIDDILAFSRMGRKEMALAAQDMQALAHEAADELASALDGRDVTIAYAALPPAAGDAAMLRQVWMNLLANAIKFTRPKPHAVIDVGSQSTAGEDVFFVRDNGVGFDMQYAGKLFGVFQRLHGIDEFEGTGIGLAIVKRIVTRHGGRVWAEGRVGEGATFYFALPKAPAQAQAGDAAAPVQTPSVPQPQATETMA